MRTLTDASNWATITVPEFADPYSPGLFETTFQLFANRTKYLYDLAGGIGGLPSGSAGQVLVYGGEGWVGSNGISLPAGAARTITVSDPAETGDGDDLILAGAAAQTEGSGGDVILRGGVAQGEGEVLVDGSAKLQTADGGTVVEVSGTIEAPKFAAFGVEAVPWPSIARGTATLQDIAEALAALGWIELTGSWPE